ncbi:hypothetical protein RMATCC62417_11275 [Rhizopus microsporus]|nr:hypothetical protein RMATCC62417_11275 [Rhizopus microsporus]
MAANTSKKRKRTPSDVTWCLNHASSLSLKSFAHHFKLYDRQYCQARYRAILEKYFEDDAKASLLAELKQWNLSMDSTNFWKEQARSKVMSDAHASCSALVNQIIVEETPHVDRSNDSPSATASTSNASTSQNETNLENTTSSHSNATNTFSNSLPPSSTTSFDNDSSSDFSSNESFSPWLVHNINVTDLFRTYQQQISTESTFKIETDLQEILALSDILFLAPNEHSTLKSQVFGLTTLHSL